MSDEAWTLLNNDDVPGLLRHLRFSAADMEQAEVARLMQRAAEKSGFEDLRQAATALAREPQSPQALFDYGYACIERGVPFLAIPALRAALAIVPDSAIALRELVSALEDETRHAEAVVVLDEHAAILEPWPDRYLVAFNALMAGDLPRATTEAAQLPAPEEEHWVPARDRLTRMLTRAQAVQAVTTLDTRDLRGWHFVIGGSVLATLSPYGFNEGMTGRYAYTGDSFGGCRRTLDRLRLILAAAGREPKTVSLLSDRASHVLGLAAARVLGLPAEPFTPDRHDTLVVAYNLNDTDAAQLWERAPGQVLFEHATCWTEPPPVSADISGFLHQTVTEPWGQRLRQADDGSVQVVPPSERPVEELAEEIVQATPNTDEGADPDDALVHLTTAIRDHWCTAPRGRALSSGPVPSSRFL